MPAPVTRQAGSGPRPRQRPPRHDGRSNRRVYLGGLPHDSLCRLGPPPEGALRGVQPTSVARRNSGCRGRPILRAFAGARPAEPCLRLLKGRKGKIKTHNEITETGVPSDTYPL
jgi:hypothetical protein